MLEPDDQFDAELDSRLRDVRMPERLFASLADLARASNDGERVRSQPGEPAGEPRLEDQHVVFDQHIVADQHVVEDQHVEEQLREVPMPRRVPKRLRHIPRTQAARTEGRTPGELLRAERLPDELPFEAEIDRCLRAVTIPPQLEARLGRIPLESARGRRRFWRVAVAAVLLVSVSWAISGSVWQVAVEPKTDQSNAARPEKPAPRLAAGPAATKSDGDPATDSLVTLEPPRRPAPEPLEPIAPAELAIPIPGNASDDPAVASNDPASTTPAIDPVLTVDDPVSRAALLTDVAETPWGVFAANAAFDELPDLHKARGLAPRGFEAPTHEAWDTIFLRQYRVHPLVSAAALPEISPPLTRAVASYELWSQYLNAGELPPAETVRTEEFLAGIDYQFPPPTTQAVGIRAALGPCPWGGPDRYLMLVGLQAADLPRPAGVATSLTIAVDVSASMQRSGRLEMAQRAIARLVDELGPDDRLSLVTFGSRARVVIEEAGPEDRAALLAVLAALEPENSTNLGAGLQLAYAVAEASPAAGLRRRVALVTDGLTELDPLTARQIEAGLQKSRAEGIDLAVIDASGEPQGEAPLKLVAGWADRPRRQPSSAVELGRALRETLWDQSQVVAAGARLTLRFDPATVARYRLVGHEATSVAGLLPATAATDLYVRDTAVVLFELELEPAGAASELAHAHLSWQNPADGSTVGIDQPISRRQIAASFREAALPLQAATVAALAAELLRNSHYVQGSNWAQARELTTEVNHQLAAQPDFARLTRQIQRTAEARGFRGRARGQ
jgi:Ca-activated chloride channel family protein